MILWRHYSCFLFSSPIWGRFPFWLIFFKGVDTTNQIWFVLFSAYINARNGVVQFFTSHKAIRLAFDFFPVLSMACFVARRLHPGISSVLTPWRCSIPRSHLCVWWRSLRASLVSLKSLLAGWKNVGRKPCLLDRKKKNPINIIVLFNSNNNSGAGPFF